MQSGQHRGDRIVLPDDLDESDVEDGVKLMNAEKVRDATASVEFGLVREVIWHMVNGYYIHYGLQQPYEVGFVFASGPEKPDVDELTGMLQDYFEPPQDDIIADTERIIHEESGSDSSTTKRALLRLGLAAPNEEDSRFFDKIVAAMRSSDDAMREGGVWAAAYAMWPRLLPELENLQISEHNSVIRAQASATIEHMKSNGIVP